MQITQALVIAVLPLLVLRPVQIRKVRRRRISRLLEI